MRIVVTGASGQLGSYMIDRLKDGPHEIVAWSGATGHGRRVRGPAHRVDRLPRRRAGLESADPDVLIHAAASAPPKWPAGIPIAVGLSTFLRPSSYREWAAAARSATDLHVDRPCVRRFGLLVYRGR